MADNIDKMMRNDVNNRNPIFIINNKGEIIDVNDDFCREVGCTKDEILGKSIEEASFLTESTREKAMHRHDSNLIGKEAVIHDFDVITRKGDVLSLEIDAKPCFKDDVIVGEMGIVRKTTTRAPDELKSRKPRRKRIRDEEDRDSQLELKKKLQEINEMQVELNRRQEEIDSMNTELETRNTIIAEIKKQLTEKQIGVVEKTGVADQLHTEMQHQQKELQLKNEELGVAKLEIEDKTKEIDQIKTELENRNRELLEKNVEINQLNTKLEEMTEEVKASKSALKWFEIDLEKKQGELESMNTELETRNTIIAEIKKQLTEKQTDVIDRTKNIHQLQTELERKQEEIESLNTRFQENFKEFSLADRGKNASDLMSIRSEIEHVDGVLRNKQRELESLDKSIELKTKELDDLNLKLEENVSALKLVESDLEGKREGLAVEEGPEEIPSGEALKGRLKMYDEIDRCLDAADDNLKTKKIEEDDSEEL